jgi:hypothetical protein
MVAPRGTVAPHWRAFRNPYYSFRPHFRIGIGFYIGYPVPFPAYWDYPYPYDEGWPVYGYDDGYGYAYGSGNGYYDPGSYGSYGGVSLDVTPPDASVYVDGERVGQVQDFWPTSPPLTLALGTHHIDIIAPGYQTLAFDVNVLAGQVIPYRGALQPARW